MNTYTPHNCDDFDPADLGTYLDCRECYAEAMEVEDDIEARHHAEEMGDNL